MANNCDDPFQQVQRLMRMRAAIDAELQKITAGGNDSDLPAAFLRDRNTGEGIEVNFDRWFREAMVSQSDAMADFAARAVGEMRRPAGDQGWFINAAQLVDRIGTDSAEEMVALMEAFTISWEKGNPADFARVTAINDREVFAQRLADGFAEAQLAIDRDSLAQAIVINTVPFLKILDNQTRLQVFADVTRANMNSKLALVIKQIEDTGLPPDDMVKAEFAESYRKAVFAHRSAALSRRVSGQLLQQLQQDPGMDLSGITGRLSQDMLDQARRVFSDLPDGEDAVLGRVAEASSRGVDGVQDLREIMDTLDEELPDPKAPAPDTDFKHNWRRNARAYYKDSQLFSGNTQLINNYLSGKLIFAAEGVRKAGENAVILKAQDVTQPIATRWTRNLPGAKELLEGARVAAEAGILAHDAIRQSWRDSVKHHFFESDTPFAGNPDTLGTKGTQDIAEQYNMALKVLYGESEDASAVQPGLLDDSGDVPLDSAPPAGRMATNDASIGNFFGSFMQEPVGYWPLVARDKVFVGLKLLGNHLIEKAGGPKLPVTSALQMMGAVDHRAGLRVFMTTRANQLLLDRIKLKPNESWADRKAWVSKQLDDQLYQATPTDQNIRDARQQFGMDDLSDEEIASFLAAEKIGTPVLVNPAQRDAFNFSGYARLQTRPEGYAGQVDDAVMKLRGERYTDALFPYWRSPFNQLLWTFKNARPPLVGTAKIIFKIGGEPTSEQLAKVAGGWVTSLGMVGMFAALDSMGVVEGSGPLDPQARRQWLAEGNRPNSMFGIPLVNLSALPVLGTLFLYKDLKETFLNGEYSDYDRYNGWVGLLQVMAGQLMRQTSIGQFYQLTELLLDPTESRVNMFAGYLLNGQLNPASGPMRDIERFSQLRQRDLYAPRQETKRDQELWDEVHPDDPLEQVKEALRRLAYNSVPSVAAAMGQPIKDTDYLGYKLRMPEGIFRSEWQQKMGVGTPALWPSWAPMSSGSRSPVHAVLDRIGLLVPPDPLVSGRMDGVLMGEGLEKEYNHHVGTVKGGPISDSPIFGNRLVWRRNAKEVYQDLDGRMVETTPYSTDLNNGGFMDRLTQGKTLEQALRGLFASQTWKKLEANPEFTTDRSITDRPKAEIQRLPGTRMVQLLHDYYGHLAKEEIESSQSPAAVDWRKQRDAKVAKENQNAVEAQTGRAEALIGQ